MTRKQRRKKVKRIRLDNQKRTAVVTCVCPSCKSKGVESTAVKALCYNQISWYCEVCNAFSAWNTRNDPWEFSPGVKPIDMKKALS